VGLALAIALDVGGLCAAMACAKGVGENVSRLPCGGEVGSLLYNMSAVSVPSFLILYLVGGVSRSCDLSPWEMFVWRVSPLICPVLSKENLSVRALPATLRYAQ
jgi:tetrahydromethanopterin S-methyltransferase subunit D